MYENNSRIGYRDVQFFIFRLYDFFGIFSSTNDLLCQKNIFWIMDQITFESDVAPHKAACNTTRKTWHARRPEKIYQIRENSQQYRESCHVWKYVSFAVEWWNLLKEQIRYLPVIALTMKTCSLMELEFHISTFTLRNISKSFGKVFFLSIFLNLSNYIKSISVQFLLRAIAQVPCLTNIYCLQLILYDCFSYKKKALSRIIACRGILGLLLLSKVFLHGMNFNPLVVLRYLWDYRFLEG